MLPSHYLKSSLEIHLLTSQYFIGLPLLFIISLHLLGMEATRLVRKTEKVIPSHLVDTAIGHLYSCTVYFLISYLELPKDFQFGSNLDSEKTTEGLEFYVYCGSSFELPWQYV